MKTTSSSDIQHLLRDLDESGLSIAAFARDQGIPAQRLYDARRRSRESRAEPAVSDFEELRIVDSPSTGEAAIEFQLPCGASVKLTRDFDAIALQRLLAVIDQC